MYCVYILYSTTSGKTFTGLTNDIERPLTENNVIETSGFTLRVRPWKLIHTVCYENEPEAMNLERFFKTGQGREQVEVIVRDYLNRQ